MNLSMAGNRNSRPGLMAPTGKQSRPRWCAWPPSRTSSRRAVASRRQRYA